MPVEDLLAAVRQGKPRALARAISRVENNAEDADAILAGIRDDEINHATIIGITGPPGAGKSTLTGRLIAYYRKKGGRVGIIAIDPTSPVSGGAILGDRVRMMDHALDTEVVIRSMATRGRLGGLCAAAGSAARIMAASGCSPVIIETVGVGQSEMDVVRLADITLLVLAPGLGDDIQAMKAGLLEVADILVVNKDDSPGAETLAKELEEAVRERSGDSRPATVCSTSAAYDRGIDVLAAVVEEVDQSHRQSGEHAVRRERARDLEILDWALELVRPQVLAAVRGEDIEKTGDPKRIARHVLQQLGILQNTARE